MTQSLLALFTIFVVLLTLAAFWRTVVAVVTALELSVFAFGLIQVATVAGGVR